MKPHDARERGLVIEPHNRKPGRAAFWKALVHRRRSRATRRGLRLMVSMRESVTLPFSCFVRGLPQPKGSKRPFIINKWRPEVARAVTVDVNAPKMRTWERGKGGVDWI